MNRDEKSQKKPRKMDKSLIHEAEHNSLLKSLEKNLEIPQEFTYADRKTVDSEVSTLSETVLPGMISHQPFVLSDRQCGEQKLKEIPTRLDISVDDLLATHDP